MKNQAEIRKLTVLPLGILMMVGLMGSYTVPFVIGGLVEGLGLDTGRAGMLGAVEILGIAISALVFSSMVSRWSLRSLALVAIIICALAQLASAFTEQYDSLLLLRALVGISSGALLAVANSVIATSKVPETLYGWVLAISSSGFALLLMCLPLALKFDEQQGLFITLAAVTLLGFTCIGSIPKPPATRDRHERETFDSVSIPTVSFFFVILTIVYIVMGGTWSFTERVAVDIDIDRNFVGILLGLSTVAGIAGAASAALIGTRWGRALPVSVGFIVSGLSVLLIAVADSTPLYAIGILLYGYMYMFTIAFVLGLGAALDSAGRVAIAANGYLLVPYSLGPVILGLTGVGNVAILGWIGFSACVFAALLIVPITRNAERSTVRTQLGYDV